MDIADANLVIAAVNPDDSLHARAMKHLRENVKLSVPLSVSLEVLLVARREGWDYSGIIDTAGQHFVLESEQILLTAVEALVDGSVPTAFDAVHAATALYRRVQLHTADGRLSRARFPTRQS